MGLETVEFVMHAEKKFDIKISNDEASKTETVGAFTVLCHQKTIPKTQQHTLRGRCVCSHQAHLV